MFSTCTNESLTLTVSVTLKKQNKKNNYSYQSNFGKVLQLCLDVLKLLDVKINVCLTHTCPVSKMLLMIIFEIYTRKHFGMTVAELVTAC